MDTAMERSEQANGSPSSIPSPGQVASPARAADSERHVFGIAASAIGRHHRATRLATLPLRRLWLDVAAEGRGAVPTEGPVILAANHLSFIDSIVLMYSLGRPVVVLGKVEYLERPICRTLFPAAGMIPVDRGGRGVATSLAIAADRLRSGGVVGIFPEGTRSRDGDLHTGHVGAAHLALHTGAPIVPVGIVGTDRVQPPGRRTPRLRGRVDLRFGAALDLGPWVGRGRTSAVKLEITEELMASIGHLSGQCRAMDDDAVATRRVPLLE